MRRPLRVIVLTHQGTASSCLRQHQLAVSEVVSDKPEKMTIRGQAVATAPAATLGVAMRTASIVGGTLRAAAAAPTHSAAAAIATAGTIAEDTAQLAAAEGRAAVSNKGRSDEATVASAEGTVPSCSALSEV